MPTNSAVHYNDFDPTKYTPTPDGIDDFEHQRLYATDKFSFPNEVQLGSVFVDPYAKRIRCDIDESAPSTVEISTRLRGGFILNPQSIPLICSRNKMPSTPVLQSGIVAAEYAAKHEATPISTTATLVIYPTSAEVELAMKMFNNFRFNVVDASSESKHKSMHLNGLFGAIRGTRVDFIITTETYLKSSTYPKLQVPAGIANVTYTPEQILTYNIRKLVDVCNSSEDTGIPFELFQFKRVIYVERSPDSGYIHDGDMKPIMQFKANYFWYATEEIYRNWEPPKLEQTLQFLQCQISSKDHLEFRAPTTRDLKNPMMKKALLYHLHHSQTL